MIKKELIKRISNIAGLNQKAARLALESIIDILIETLANGEEIKIRGFGSMQKKIQHAKKYYHFAAKEIRISKEKMSVSFKPSNQLLVHNNPIDSRIHIKTISELGFIPQIDSVLNYNSGKEHETTGHQKEQPFAFNPPKSDFHISSEGNLIIPNKLNIGKRRQLKHEKEEQIFDYVGTVIETINSYGELSYEEKNYPTLLIPRPGIKILNYNHCGQITGGITEPILYYGLEEKIKAIEPEIDILRNVALPIKNRNYGYKPDIALVWQKYNLYFDIEIDEPYDIISRRPIHYIGGSDTLRNGYFLQNGWYVIRISEEQVVKQTENVVNYICKMIFCMTEDERFNINYNDYNSRRWTEESARQMASDNKREEYLGIKRIDTDTIQQTVSQQDIDEYSTFDQFSFTRPDIQIIDCDMAKKNDIKDIINNFKFIIIKRLYDGYEFISEKNYMQEVVDNYHYGLKIYDIVEGIFLFIAYDNIDSYRGINTMYKEFEDNNAKQIIPQAIFGCNPITFLYHRSSDDKSNTFRVIVLYPTYWYEDDFEKLKDEMTPKQLLGEALMWTLKNCETYETTSYFSGLYHKSLRTYKSDRMTDLRVYDCFKPAFSYGVNEVWGVLNKGQGLTAEIMLANFPNFRKKTLLNLGNLCNAYIMQGKIDLAIQIFLSYDKGTNVHELSNSWGNACMADIDHFISNDIHKSEFEEAKRILQEKGW